MQLNYCIIFVSDMERSVSFYRDVFGLPLKFESPEWTEFATEGATVALHASENRDSENAGVQATRAGLCRPGLSVANLDEFHQRMIISDVLCIQAPKATFGARIAQYADPDGLTISVSEETENE